MPTFQEAKTSFTLYLSEQGMEDPNSDKWKFSIHLRPEPKQRFNNSKATSTNESLFKTRTRRHWHEQIGITMQDIDECGEELIAELLLVR